LQDLLIDRSQINKAETHSQDSVVVGAEDGRADDHLGDTIRITIGRRTTILQVSTTILTYLARNADRRSTVCNSSREVVNAAGLVMACQATLVVATSGRIIHTDVTHVLFAQLLNCFLDCSNATAATELMTARQTTPSTGD